MFKAILIEDDIQVLRQLNKIISGIESDFQIVMTFTHPLDAIAYMKQNKIDAVITDIQLPEMTGIELCEYCQKHFPEVKFAILSAYDYFEYAQKAIDLEVVHYILKPVTIAKLETLLKKLSERLSRRENSEGFVASSVNLNRQQTILNLLSGFYSEYSGFFKDMENNDVILNYETCKCASVLLKSENFREILKEKPSYSSEEIYQIVSKIAARNDSLIYSVLFNYSEDTLLVFAFCKKDMDIEKFKTVISDYTSSLVKDIKNILNTNAVVDSSETFPNIDEFYKSQRKNSSFEEQAKNIMSYVYGNDFDAAIRCVEAVRMIFDDSQVKKVYTCILSYLSKLTQRILPKEELSSEKLLNIIISDIKDVKRYNLTNNSKADVIEKACKFINENFANDITLNDVAKHVFLSPIYFSSYFKKKTGEKYSDYLANVKLQKALELLKDTDVKIPTIAEMSGFRDTNYFHKIFKNQTGLTPSEYRKKYRRTHS